MKNIRTPVPASHEVSCWLPLPACLQGWQGAEASRKLLSDISSVACRERDNYLPGGKQPLPSFLWLSYKPPSYQEKGQILWTRPRSLQEVGFLQAMTLPKTRHKIINGPQGTLVHVFSPCSPAANDSVGWHSAKVVLPSSRTSNQISEHQFS